MFENRVFDIFVYRLSPEQRSAERKRLRSASTDPTIIYGGMGKEKGEAFWANLTEEEQREIKRHWEYMFDNSTEARGWLYNDVIGYVAVFAGLNQIKSEYWFIEGRIQRNAAHRIFVYHDKIFDFWVSEHDSSQDIFNSLERELLNLKSRPPFKGRYLDLEVFHNIGPALDWKKLTGTRDKSR